MVQHLDTGVKMANLTTFSNALKMKFHAKGYSLIIIRSMSPNTTRLVIVEMATMELSVPHVYHLQVLKEITATREPVTMNAKRAKTEKLKSSISLFCCLASQPS